MRLIVFSDIHGNDAALRAALEHLDKELAQIPFRLIINGDSLGPLPGGREVLNLLRSRNALFIRGNHEDYLDSGRQWLAAGEVPPGWKNVAWLLRRLEVDVIPHLDGELLPEWIHWKGQLRIRHAQGEKRNEMPKGSMHRTPRSHPPHIRREAGKARSLELLGHAHVVYHYHDTDSHVIVCGSIGQAFCDARPRQNGVAHGCFLVLDTERATDSSVIFSAEERWFRYSTEQLVRSCLDSGFFAHDPAFAFLALAESLLNEDLFLEMRELAQRLGIPPGESLIHPQLLSHMRDHILNGRLVPVLEENFRWAIAERLRENISLF